MKKFLTLTAWCFFGIAQLQAQFTLQTQNIACFGACNGSARVVVTGQYKYHWNTGDSTAALTNLCAGNYYCTVSDTLGGFLDSLSTAITQPAQLTITGTVTNTCIGGSGGTIVVTVSGGTPAYSYAWSDASTMANRFGLSAGTYTITLTDSHACTATGSYTVTAINDSIQLTPTVTNSSTCSACNGSIQLAATGSNPPFFFNWSDGDTSQSPAYLCQGTYAVTATDSLGCAVTAVAVVNALSDNLHATFTNTNLTCSSNVDTTTVVITGGVPPYFFNWGDGDTSLWNIGTVIHAYLYPRFYSITVQDSNGCYFYLADTVLNSGIILRVLQVQNTYCNSPNSGRIFISASGANGPPFNYHWNNNATTDSIVGVAAGNYSVTVSDSTGCSITLLQNIDQNNYEQGYYVYLSSTAQNCGTNNGTANSSVYGGHAPFTYLWSDSATTADLTGLGSGTLDLTVTDAVGCSATGYAYIGTTCVTTISGVVYNDLNHNCVLDSGETGVPNVSISASSPSGRQYYANTDANGNYSITVQDTGLFTVQIPFWGNGTNCGNFTLCGNSNENIYVGALGLSYPNNDYAFESSQPSFNLGIHPGWHTANPGFQKTYWIYYYNSVTTQPTGTVTVSFNYDPNLQFVSSVPAPTNIDLTNHLLSWNINPPIGSWVQIYPILFNVPSSLSINYLLQNTFRIDPTVGDCDSSDNVLHFAEIVTGCHDPNEKTVQPADNISTDDSILIYTIHFQNDGTDSTHFIIVKDTLSPSLDPATVRNVASSHKYSSFNISGNGILTWVFNPISLPDSLEDVNGSKGFVSFSVKKRAGLPAGAIISNTASVYFDYNTPVQTNRVSDTLVNPTGIIIVPEPVTNVSVTAFPNPFNASVNVVVNGLNAPYSFELYDVMGRLVKQIPSLNTKQFTIQRSDMSSGVYMYRIIYAGRPVAYGKLVAE